MGQQGCGGHALTRSRCWFLLVIQPSPEGRLVCVWPLFWPGGPFEGLGTSQKRRFSLLLLQNPARLWPLLSTLHPGPGVWGACLLSSLTPAIPSPRAPGSHFKMPFTWVPYSNFLCLHSPSGRSLTPSHVPALPALSDWPPLPVPPTAHPLSPAVASHTRYPFTPSVWCLHAPPLPPFRSLSISERVSYRLPISESSAHRIPPSLPAFPVECVEASFSSTCSLIADVPELRSTGGFPSFTATSPVPGAVPAPQRARQGVLWAIGVNPVHNPLWTSGMMVGQSKPHAGSGRNGWVPETLLHLPCPSLNWLEAELGPDPGCSAQVRVPTGAPAPATPLVSCHRQPQEQGLELPLISQASESLLKLDCPRQH